MRAEVIIAVRGEVPANLNRTLTNVALTIGPDDGICVVWDGEEPYALHEIDFLRQERLAEPRGCGHARHFGITTSPADYVVLIDGHMQFPLGWLDAVCTHLRRHGKDITCTINRSVRHDWTPYSEIDSGAELCLHVDGPRVEPYGPAREFYGLVAQWRKGARPGVVAAPMGACYGMRRAWYGTIGRPLGILDAWGCDEELLGVCSWLCGGRVYCLDIETRHVHNAPRINRSVDTLEIWANRAAVLLSIPGAPSETTAYIRQTRVNWPDIDRRVAARADRIEALRAHLAAGARTFDRMLTAGLITRNPATIVSKSANPAPRPSAFHGQTQPGRCDRCNAVGCVRHVAVGEVYMRCLSCGHRRRVG